MKAAVVVPVWRPTLTPAEELSLRRCLSVLAAHDVTVISPEGMPLDAVPFHPAAPAVERFGPEFFAGIGGYNRLMLSAEFYTRFAAYDYILIYQLDAFVFEDRLTDWCARGYDYVGAPWIGEGWPEDVSPLRRRILHALTSTRTRVGNGGFSLRRVPSFRRAIRRLSPLLRWWTSNEDLFWGVVARRLASFRIPPAEEALSFSFELEPRRCYERLGRRLPFGCHGWPRYDPDFWREVFASLGTGLNASVSVASPKG
jgi:Protein of unknown function (DUF5672)